MKTIGWYTMTLLAIAVSAYAIVIVAVPGMRNEFLVALFAESAFSAYAHLIGGAIALAIGPFQLSSRIRNRHLSVHRLLGRIYVGAILVGGSAGLSLAISATGGLPAKFGFGMMAVVWLITTVMALINIRNRRIAEHQAWMIRSFAVTLAAVTLRFYLPISIASGNEFIAVYPVIAWLCWVPNLIIAEWLFVSRVATQRAAASYS
ncbi:MAG: DUF2306 domain-containing protein [Pseudomonadota bacterium]